jgi:conjugative transfer signal peptidase TraF
MTRFGYVMAAYFATMAMIITAFIHPLPRLIWNASASVPVGLYRLHLPSSPMVGELVAIQPPKELGSYLAARHYLPRGVPMLKHIAAVAGQRVCRTGTRITADGKYLGDARSRDRLGRPLPVWAGCRLLSPGDVFLMNGDVPDSFDGRYFGPLPAVTIIGRLSPFWILHAGERAGSVPKIPR